MVEQKSQKISTSDRADEEHGAANGYDEEGLELRAKMPRSDSMPMMPDPSAMDWSAAGVRCSYSASESTLSGETPRTAW